MRIDALEIRAQGTAQGEFAHDCPGSQWLRLGKLLRHLQSPVHVRRGLSHVFPDRKEFA